MAASIVGASAASIVAFAACSSSDPLGAPPRIYNFGGSTSSGGGGLNVGNDDAGPPDLDAGGLCGNQILPALINAPNIYFILDTSGSMGAPANGSTRYEVVRSAAIDLVRNLGPLINVGAALFPHKASAANPCHPGAQVFPVTAGDAYTGADGKTTIAFKSATKATPTGGTPTSASLSALYPTLVGLSGKTIVLLATDGGPNCNTKATCTLSECISNIEGDPACDPAANCCSPQGPAGPAMCIDEPATLSAISDLAAAGIDVYVIGVPGSDVYGDVLDAMAVAGGTAQAGSPQYYKVSDLDELGGVLGGIASVVISCEIDLMAPPPDKDLTNVYLDQQLLPYDVVDGWRWASETAVELRGEACDRLKTGKVKQVQVVSGCPTEAAK